MEKNKNIIEDQELFFNKAAKEEKSLDTNDFFFQYASKEQVQGFNWISDKRIILDYGCGTGTSMDLFFKGRDRGAYFFYGVDIAKAPLEMAEKKYPEFKFFKISDNKIPQIEGEGISGAYLLHVLHHTRDHSAIFEEIYSKLEKGGKFFLSDLSSKNPIIKLGRSIFCLCPSFFKNRFSEDLVVEGKIPEKYKVDIKEVQEGLRQAGFFIEETGFGHLFFFLFCWVDRFIPLLKLPFIPYLYSKLILLERWLLSFSFFRGRAEVFYIKCVKNGVNSI